MSEETYKFQYRYNGIKNVDDKSYTGDFTKVIKEFINRIYNVCKDIKSQEKRI